MGILDLKNDNLVTLLEGMSLLEERDQERFIRAVDTLDLADKKVKKDMFYDNPLLKFETPAVYTDDKI
jgi:hypothetical protein